MSAQPHTPDQQNHDQPPALHSPSGSGRETSPPAMPGTRQPWAPPPRRQSPKCHPEPSTGGGSTEERPGRGSGGSSPSDKLRPRAPLRPHSPGGKRGDRHSPELPGPLGDWWPVGTAAQGHQAGRAGQAGQADRHREQPLDTGQRSSGLTASTSPGRQPEASTGAEDEGHGRPSTP